MPRETVAGDNRCALEVCWSRDAGHLQVATVARDPVDALNRALTDAGLVLADKTTRNEAGSAQLEQFAATLSGWHVDLERADVNRLIRTAQRGRDQAMGRDA